MDIKQSPNSTCFAGGFPVNDNEMENPGPRAISPNNYVDLSPLGNWVHHVPNFPSNATDEEKSGLSYLHSNYLHSLPHIFT